MSEQSAAGGVNTAGDTAARARDGRGGRTGAGTPGWTTSRWLSVGVGATLAVLITLGALGAWLFAHATSVNTRLVDNSTPALIAAVRLDAALVNQETGVRGYGMTGRTEFLEPYRLGTRMQDDAVDRLRRLLAVDGDLTPALDTVLAQAGVWHRVYADPVVTAPVGAPVPFATAQASAGKAAFDALRAASSGLQDHLTAPRNQARSDLISVRTQRNWAFGAIAIVILAVAVLMFVGLRRAVSTPLGQLADDAGRVAAGTFDHPIRSSGPADMQALATTVELMRSRLADALVLAADEADADLTHDPLPAVMGNPAQLEILVTNLLGNAIKFRHPDRTPTIHVGADRDGEHRRITVTDNGIGIEPQYSDRIFMIFQRLHTHEEYPGTGIGLAMCKKIVEFHGGRIGIDGEYSEGTRIWFTLPAAEPATGGGDG